MDLMNVCVPTRIFHAVISDEYVQLTVILPSDWLEEGIILDDVRFQ
jgi:hypothetical protein